jgi:hypothetical protein
MGLPLKEQLDHPHADAKRSCVGCWGSGWLTALVDNPGILDDAGETKPVDFVMKCGECDCLSDDDEAASAAREAGMKINEHFVVQYTTDQIEFLGEVGLVENPELYILHFIAAIVKSLALWRQLPSQILSVSTDGDHKSAEIIFELLTTEGIRSFCVSSGTITEVEEDE